MNDEGRTGRASRRQVLAGMGLLGAAGAAGVLGVSGATAAAAAGAAAAGAGAGSQLSALGVTAAALPPVIPGARTKALLFSDAMPLGNSASAELGWNNGTYLTAGGFMDVPLGIESGSRVLRVDIYGNRTASGNVQMILYRGTPSTGGFGTFVATITSNTGTGVLTGAYTTPFTVADGESLYLESGSFASTAVTFTGAIVTYFDAKPQLNLLAAPIRVYDSRPGLPPSVGVKSPLSFGATRVTDCTYGGAVPAGAAAALVTLTAANTSAAGYLALFKNGIAYPGNSTLNWDHPGVVATTTTVALDAAGSLKAYVNGSTDYLIDVIGFYA